MKLLLIGEVPNVAGAPPFAGRPERFLSRLLGIDAAGFRLAFDLVNLLDLPQPPQRSGKGRTFNSAGARLAAGKIDVTGRVVLVAGRRALGAFGAPQVPFLSEVFLGRGERAAFLFPHPSGIVLWWNDGGNRRRAARLLKWLIGAKGKGPSLKERPERKPLRRTRRGLRSYALVTTLFPAAVAS